MKINTNPKNILIAVSKASGISLKELKSSSRKREIATARGIYFMICQEKGIDSTKASKLVNRSRSSVSRQGTNYRSLALIGDKSVCKLLDKVNKELKSYEYRTKRRFVQNEHSHFHTQ